MAQELFNSLIEPWKHIYTSTVTSDVGEFDDIVELRTPTTFTGSQLLTGLQLKGGIIIGNSGAGLYVLSLDTAINIQNALKLKNGQTVQVFFVNRGASSYDVTITDTTHINFNNTGATSVSVSPSVPKTMLIRYTGDLVTPSFELFM